MLFTSFDFAFFFIAVIVIYYCLPMKWRWGFLLAASAYFYLNWEPIYAVLLFITTCSTYAATVVIDRASINQSINRRKRKIALWAGCAVPLLSLLLFKYYNFITDSIHGLLQSCGVDLAIPRLEFLMPLGISFYSFTAIGYIIDVYKGKYAAERNFGITALFISFFAQISSGPIPRGNQLIPQLRTPHPLQAERFMHGFRSFIWGLFMKLCIADRVAIYVATVYGNLPQHNGGSVLTASLLYTIQIYCDFAGYSLMAIGTARMLGIDLIENFRRPYFATSFKDFWSRWHISLSTWFRDYVYIPLGGSRVSKTRHKINLVVTFLVSGLWHGAAWNFLLWGGMHGALQVVEGKGTKEKKQRNLVVRAIKLFAVFMCVSFAWIFFRVTDINEAFGAIGKIFTDIGIPMFDMTLVYAALTIALLLIKDTVDEYFPKVKLMSSPNFFVSNTSTALLCAVIMLFGVFDNSQFIYFQF